MGKGLWGKDKGKDFGKGYASGLGKRIFEGKGWEMAREMTDGDWGKGLGSRLWGKGQCKHKGNDWEQVMGKGLGTRL